MGTTDFLKSEIITNGTGVADGVSAFTVLVRLMNSDGSIVSGFRPTYSITSGSGVITAPCSVSDNTGTAVCLLKANTPGAKRILVDNLPLKLEKDLSFIAPLLSGKSIVGAAPGSQQHATGGGYKMQSTVGAPVIGSTVSGSGVWKMTSSVQGVIAR